MVVFCVISVTGEDQARISLRERWFRGCEGLSVARPRRWCVVLRPGFDSLDTWPPRMARGRSGRPPERRLRRRLEGSTSPGSIAASAFLGVVLDWNRPRLFREVVSVPVDRRRNRRLRDMTIPETEVTEATDNPAIVSNVPTGNTIRRNLAVLAGGQATTWTMTLLWTLVVPRLLGPSGLGLITAVWAAAAIMSIVLGLGTTNYVARELVAHPAAAGSLVGTALVLRVIMVPVFVAGAVTFAHFAHYGHDARLVLWLATGATLFTLLDEPLLVAFQAKEHMQYMAYSDVINKSAQGLVGIAIVVIGFGAVGLTASWLAVSSWSSFWGSDGSSPWYISSYGRASSN